MFTTNSSEYEPLIASERISLQPTANNPKRRWYSSKTLLCFIGLLLGAILFIYFISHCDHNNKLKTAAYNWIQMEQSHSILPSFNPFAVKPTYIYCDGSPKAHCPANVRANNNMNSMDNVTALGPSEVALALTPRSATPELLQPSQLAHLSPIMNNIRHYIMGNSPHTPLPEPLQLLQTLQLPTSSLDPFEGAISQHGGTAHINNDKLDKERGGPLLQPRLPTQLPTQLNKAASLDPFVFSVANIDKERGGPLLQPHASYLTINIFVNICHHMRHFILARRILVLCLCIFYVIYMLHMCAKSHTVIGRVANGKGSNGVNETHSSRLTDLVQDSLFGEYNEFVQYGNGLSHETHEARIQTQSATIITSPIMNICRTFVNRICMDYGYKRNIIASNCGGLRLLAHNFYGHTRNS